MLEYWANRDACHSLSAGRIVGKADYGPATPVRLLRGFQFGRADFAVLSEPNRISRPSAGELRAVSNKQSFESNSLISVKRVSSRVAVRELAREACVPDGLWDTME